MFHQEAVTNAVEEWLRESLRQDGKQFLVVEPVLKQRNRSIVWDLDAEVIIAMQHPHQLSTGEIFDKTSDWRDARAQIMAQEAGFKVEVSVTSYDLGQRSRKQTVGVTIKEALRLPPVANAEMVDTIRSLAKQQEGLWEPRHMEDEDGSQRPVIFTRNGMEQVTRMSELPKTPADQRFHIRNLYTHTRVSEVECENALQVLMQLQKDDEVQAVSVGGQWLLFLPAAYATDVATCINEHCTEALVAGKSVRDWCVSVATIVFLKQVRLVVRDWLWFPFRMVNDGHVYKQIDRRPEDTECLQEDGWYDTIGPFNNIAMGKTKDATLVAAAFKSNTNHKAQWLVVHTVGQEYSVVLFENSVFGKALSLQPLRVGLPLSATFPTVLKDML